MAPQQNRLVSNVHHEEETVSTVESIKKKEEMKKKKKAAEQKLAELVAKYRDSAQRFGPDHYLTVMLGSFVEMICQMKLLNDQLEAIGLAFETIATSFDFMDSTLDLITGIMTSSRQRGPFAGLKARLNARRFARSIKSRFAEFRSYIETIPGITNTISNTMESVARSFARSQEKSRKRAEKRKKNGNNPAPSGGLSPEARGVLSNMGLDEETGSTGGTPVGGAPVGCAPVGGAPVGGSSADNDFGSDIL